MGVVLSETPGVVLSGTDRSSYQEPESTLNHRKHCQNLSFNLANLESFGFFLTPDAPHRACGQCACRSTAMIAGLLNRKGGLGEPKLALHLAGQWVREAKRAVLVDADPQKYALDQSQARGAAALPRPFGGLGLAHDTLHREAPALARDADPVVIHGPPRVASLMRSASLAPDLVLIPVQPSPFDVWAWGDMPAPLAGARIDRPELAARLVPNQCGGPTVIARATADARADRDPPPLGGRVSQRVIFARTTQHGGLAVEIYEDGPAANEIALPASEFPGDRPVSSRPAWAGSYRALATPTAGQGPPAHPAAIRQRLPEVSRPGSRSTARERSDSG